MLRVSRRCLPNIATTSPDLMPEQVLSSSERVGTNRMVWMGDN